MAASQTVVVGNTTAPQPSVVSLPAAPQSNNEISRRNKSTVKGLAIAEIVIGSLCVLVSIVILAVPSYRYWSYHYGYSYRYYRFQIGEGLWCGIWIVIAGGLGIPTAKENVSRCMINCHMAFSIVGAVFAGVMFSLGVIGALVNGWSTFSVIFHSIEALFALTSMALCIASASYCCILLGCCQTMSPQMYGTQIYYQQQQPQLLGQSAPGFQQDYVMQSPPGLQPMPGTTSVSTTSYPTQQFTSNVENQQPGLGQKQAEAMANPPDYSSLAQENII